MCEGRPGLERTKTAVGRLWFRAEESVPLGKTQSGIAWEMFSGFSHFAEIIDSAKTIMEQNKENQALCNAITGLEYIDFDLPLLQQIDSISSSTKKAMKYMDETRNKKSNNIARKQLNKMINQNPKQAHREIFRDK
eukprot:1142979-Pelagomonas_calceolata.AAC.2